MFTGIVEEIGTVTRIMQGQNSSILSIRGDRIFEDLRLGDSVAVNGVCLTVSKLAGQSFDADTTSETLARTSLGALRAGSFVNLERAMAANGRFGGHIVTGHVDGTGIISMIRRDGKTVWVTITADNSILKYIVEKGSIAVDGISLTVASTTQNSFSIAVIPHTERSTTLLTKSQGETVNLECDMIGKYVERFITRMQKSEPQRCVITEEYLSKAGF
ncbi:MULTISPECIES: riboflavin synthase [Methanocorpusculum]|jgi:riboflavin synthase|uniref:Riboflavin synthase n=1 Tax=Methanocorpusculum parvum TaxID=2193 RepID=A0AAX0Q756_9EURY|nr:MULTISPECIES: riboflavin synthase [Methanocorpusculum]MDD2248468.1 riboflavin synthase [Methanocorpusculum sp.]MDD2802862.1 riboflavin synthase [Methanocorpusculum sp.]MDD3046819.1 riboflavin synthase [Methanocorpusculum sp.]MDD3911896.1 riboflavin synthase [Methanocorpusculum sp.]MDD4423687.1 riboflavin synthase [Methanocorpusculum parvum]